MASAYSTDPNSNMSEADKNNGNRLAKLDPNSSFQKSPINAPSNSGVAPLHSWEQPGVSRAYNPGAIAANPMMSPALGQATNNLRDTFSRMSTGAGIGATVGSVLPVVGTAVGAGVGAAAGGIYDIGKKIQGAWDDIKSIPGTLQGMYESPRALKHDTNTLHSTMQAHPEHVTQPTYDSLATANRQIARNEGTPIEKGVPTTGNIVNAPIPQGMPAPVPMSSLPGAIAATGQAAPSPAAPQAFNPTKEDIARFNHFSGGDKHKENRYNPLAPGDVASMQMQLGQRATPSFVQNQNGPNDHIMNSAQARQYRQGTYAQNPMQAPQAGGSSIPPRSEDQTNSERRAQLGKSMGLNGPYKGSMVDGMPGKLAN